MDWDASSYQKHHGFVAKYGASLLDYVDLKAPSCILDLGCGLGTLTAKLAAKGAAVTGCDSSPAMIKKACKLHPTLKFIQADALNLPADFDQSFDVVFSNAVFHWIDDHALLLDNILRVLRKKGRLVCEFGGSGNVQIIEQTYADKVRAHGLQFVSKFNFPTPEHFAQLLRQKGFEIQLISHFKRPTELNDGYAGMRSWLLQFFAEDLAKLPKGLAGVILDECIKALEPMLFKEGKWVADYVRLKVVAQKLN